MACADAIHSFGTRLRVSCDGGLYLNMVNHVELMGPKLTATILDVTHLNSQNAFKEKIVGYAEAGDITFKGWYDGNTDEEYDFDFNNLYRRCCSYLLLMPDLSFFIFSALMSEMEVTAGNDKAVEYNGKVTITGVVNFFPSGTIIPTTPP